MTKNSTSFQNGNQAAKKHGLDAVLRRGLEAMDEQQMGHFAAIRRQMDKYPDRLELRKDGATWAYWLAEAFFYRGLQELAEGVDLLDAKAPKRTGYYIGVHDRINADLPDEDSSAHQLEHARIAEVIENDTQQGD